MSYRPEFEAALLLFARVSEAMRARGLPAPVLVGGAAVELYSTSAVATGDFDFCSIADSDLAIEMQRVGFIRPSGYPALLRGWVHPELKLGFEAVGTQVLDGAVDADHIREAQTHDGSRFRVISVEDLIADRMGQFASGTAPDRLEQARLLLRLHPDLDLEYLERRIRHESAGEYGVEDIEG